MTFKIKQWVVLESNKSRKSKKEGREGGKDGKKAKGKRKGSLGHVPIQPGKKKV